MPHMLSLQGHTSRGKGRALGCVVGQATTMYISTKDSARNAKLIILPPYESKDYLSCNSTYRKRHVRQSSGKLKVTTNFDSARPERPSREPKLQAICFEQESSTKSSQLLLCAASREDVSSAVQDRFGGSQSVLSNRTLTLDNVKRSDDSPDEETQRQINLDEKKAKPLRVLKVSNEEVASARRYKKKFLQYQKRSGKYDETKKPWVVIETLADTLLDNALQEYSGVEKEHMLGSAIRRLDGVDTQQGQDELMAATIHLFFNIFLAVGQQFEKVIRTHFMSLFIQGPAGERCTGRGTSQVMYHQQQQPAPVRPGVPQQRPVPPQNTQAHSYTTHQTGGYYYATHACLLYATRPCSLSGVLQPVGAGGHIVLMACVLHSYSIIVCVSCFVEEISHSRACTNRGVYLRVLFPVPSSRPSQGRNNYTCVPRICTLGPGSGRPNLTHSHLRGSLPRCANRDPPREQQRTY
uniref:Uncharacterized protein n=1 Tax=Timema poppense TaxID=170557 RepID=A0A7R9DBV0_TIMPO|nr:unnamed protein product [Timema poppensis]